MKLKEFSQKIGISQTTISRALNGYSDVSEITREKIIKAAQQYHYRPSMKAIRLATGRAMAIGHVIPRSKRNEIVNPIFADFIAGAGDVYSSKGYDMLLSVVDDDKEMDAYRDMAAKANVDGVILHAPKVDDPRIELLKALNLPFAVHGRTMDKDTDYLWLDVNNKRAFERACNLLLDLGHHHIALLNGQETMCFAVRRRMGYEKALKERNITINPEYIYSGEMSENYGYQAALNLLNSDNPPSAFLTASIIAALGVRRAVEAKGLQLGKDISLITFDDEISYFKNEGDVPMFTTISSSVSKAGKRCAELILQKIMDNSSAPEPELWEANLVLGASTGPYKKE